MGSKQGSAGSTVSDCITLGQEREGKTASSPVDSFPADLPKGAAKRSWGQFEAVQPRVRLVCFVG